MNFVISLSVCSSLFHLPFPFSSLVISSELIERHRISSTKYSEYLVSNEQFRGEQNSHFGSLMHLFLFVILIPFAIMDSLVSRATTELRSENGMIFRFLVHLLAKRIRAYHSSIRQACHFEDEIMLIQFRDLQL